MDTSDREPFRVERLPRPRRDQQDRRKKRSKCAATAIELALTAAAQRGGLDAMLLVDDAGMLVANNDTSLDLSMVAAVTPIVGRGRAVPRVRRDGVKRDMTVKTIELCDELIYVAAVGGERGPRHREVLGSMAAARRILA